MFLCYISESFLFSFIKWLVFFHFILVFQRKKLYPDYIKKKKSKIKCLPGMEITLKSLNRCQYANIDHCVMHMSTGEDKEVI